MEILIPKENGAGPATVATEPKRNQKARVTPRGAHAAPSTARASKKATSTKKAPQAQKKALSVRTGSKTAKLLNLLKRPDGATLQQLIRASGWQAHSVRGFLSGQVRKKMGLPLRSSERDGERVYAI